jgi:predicted transcriptional regulator
MEKKRPRMGRPTKAPLPGERVSLGLRVTAEIKRKLDEAAEKSGRSQSQEAELRLERSFELEHFEASIAEMIDKLREHITALIRAQGKGGGEARARRSGKKERGVSEEEHVVALESGPLTRGHPRPRVREK